ncbi:sugar ABC transporter substrate-binding protein [Spirochaetia bacterium]|nr:sugar ABC transporter substrate-binding protein [Spirochaetia bacterium]
MKKVLAVTLVFLTALSMAFAGGGNQKSGGGQIELNYMEVMSSPSRTEVINRIIADYESTHPNVKINLISPPYDQADARLAMSLTAQEPLDIVEVRDITASQFVTNKWLVDLSAYTAKWNEWSTLLPTGKELASAAGGKPYMIPQFFYIPALFVRTDVLAKLEISNTAPKTLDELYALCAQITNRGQNQYGWTMRGRGNPFRQSDLHVLSNVNNVNPENLYKLKNGTSVYDSPEYLSAYQAYVDLFKNSVPQDGVNWGFNEQLGSFISGITPFLMQDPDAVPEFDKQLRRDQYTVIPMPLGRSGTFIYEPGFAGLGIPAHSKNKEAAWEFIAYISGAAQNSQICKVYGALPVHSSTFANDTYFSEGVYQAWATIMSAPDKYVTVRYPYTSEKYPGWAQVHEQYLQSTFLGQTTSEQAVKAYSDYWK